MAIVFLNWDPKMVTIYKKLLESCKQKQVFTIREIIDDKELRISGLPVKRNGSKSWKADGAKKILRWLHEDYRGFRTRLKAALTEAQAKTVPPPPPVANVQEKVFIDLLEPEVIPEEENELFEVNVKAGADEDVDYRPIFNPDKTHNTYVPWERSDDKHCSIRKDYKYFPDHAAETELVVDDHGVQKRYRVLCENFSTFFAVLNFTYHCMDKTHMKTTTSRLLPSSITGRAREVAYETFCKRQIDAAYDSALKLLAEHYADPSMANEEGIIKLDGSNQSIEEVVSLLQFKSLHVLILCSGCGARKVRAPLLDRDLFEYAFKHHCFQSERGICKKCNSVAFRVPRLNGGAVVVPPPSHTKNSKPKKMFTATNVKSTPGYHHVARIHGVWYTCMSVLVEREDAATGKRDVVCLVPDEELAMPEMSWTKATIISGSAPESKDLASLRGNVVAFMYVVR